MTEICGFWENEIFVPRGARERTVPDILGVCEGYRTAMFTVLRVEASAHKGGPISRPAIPAPPGHLDPTGPQGH